jgi:hypothetical protein
MAHSNRRDDSMSSSNSFPNPRSHSLSFAVGVALFCFACPLHAQTPAAPTTQPDPLSVSQQQVAERFKKLEELLLRSAELEAAENPTRSALLQQAAQAGKQAQLADVLARAANRLDKKQYSQAIEDQKTSRENLKRLLELLQSENREERVREQRDQVRRWIEETDRLLRLQKSLSGRTEGGQEMKQAGNDQSKLAEKAAEIAKDLGGDKSNKPNDSPNPSSSESNNEKDPKSDQSKSDGDNKDGKNKDGKSADEKSLDGKSNPNKEGDSKNTDSKENDSIQGEPKDGKKEGESKDGEAKTSDPKKGGEKQGDSKDGKEGQPEQSDQSQKGDSKESQQAGKSQEGKPQDGKPQDGKSQQGQSEQGDSGDSNPEEAKKPQPKDPTERARQRIEQAKKKMEEAKKALDDAERKGAVDRQREAESELRSAIEELEEILRQLREEEIERSLASLETRLRRMLEMQNKVLEETKRLQEIGGEQAVRQVEIRASNLALDQRKILTEGERAFLLLRDEGSSAAFPEAMEQVNADISNVAERLNKADVGALTTTIEQEIVSSLEEMIAALVQVQKENKEKKKQQQGQQQQQQGEQAEQPLVDKLAELRLIRTLQLRINSRTTALSKMLADPSDNVGQATEADILSEAKKLAERQANIQQVTKNVAQGSQ